MTSVAIVDGDAQTAGLLAHVAGAISGIEVIGTAHSARSAARLVRSHQPDLLLLDVCLPDRNGLEFLKDLRASGVPLDAIVLTAARDMVLVRDALRLGVLQYLIKPCSMDRLRQHLISYQGMQGQLRWVSASQKLVDHTLRLMHSATGGQRPGEPSNPTLQSVLGLVGAADDWVTANEVADQVGISVSTARRYLGRLVTTGKVELALQYGDSGRPTNLYRRRVLNRAA
jgi:response regulator of citrate/malate metabolism